MARRGRSALAIVLLVSACGSPTPSPPVTPGTTDQPGTPAPTSSIARTPQSSATGIADPPAIRATLPEESVALNGSPKSSSAEFAGVRLTIDVGKAWLDATFGGVVTVTITNGSRRRLEWLANGCEANASVVATTTAAWRDSSVDVSPELDGYRELLRGKVGDGPIRLSIQRPYPLLHREAGCADFTESRRRHVEPGHSVSREFIWDGGTAGRLGPPPNDVPVTFAARLERWSLVGGDGMRPIETSLDTWVVGGHAETFLSPFEAIDVALADDRFSSWLRARRGWGTDRPVVELDRDLGVWVIGVLYGDQYDFQPTLHAALIDPMTREVFAVKRHRVSF
jgi:hypothetical protein